MSTHSPSSKLVDLWLGLDIGGANIKVTAYPCIGKEAAESRSIPFALWKEPDQLGATLAELLLCFNDQRLGIVVTMTGELADGYPNRQAGVESIVDDVEFAFARFARDIHLSPVCPIYYGMGYSNGDFAPREHRWHDAESAKANWNRIAAANWHAIASCLQYLPGLGKPIGGFLVDIGSTTTDIIPIRGGLPAASGLTDLTRLQSRELFYAGVARTPVCSLVQSLIIGQQPITIAREFFATIDDCFVVSGDIAEDKQRLDTADGRPATRAFACQRLAKMVCADANFRLEDESTQTDAQKSFLGQDGISSIAQQVISALRVAINDSIQQVVKGNPDLPKRFFLTGQGDWFAKRILEENFGSDAELHNIVDYVGESNSRSMAAFAVAKLAANDRPEIESPIVIRRKDQIDNYRVIKIGGSLIESSKTPGLIRDWLSCQENDYQNIWIVGGGKIVDQIRRFDKSFQLTDSTAHWLALDAMSLNLRMIQHWFPDWPLVDDWDLAKVRFREARCRNVLFDFTKWLRVEPMLASRLSESWRVTSDSCAAFFAQQIGAQEVVLFKSCHIDRGRTLMELAQDGIVDPSFPHFASSVSHVHVVNLNAET